MSALERYGVLGIVVVLLIAAFVWYQRTADKFREERRGDIKQLRIDVREAEKDRDEWRDRYYVLRDTGKTSDPPGEEGTA